MQDSLATDDLRCGVIGASARCFEEVPVRHDVRQPKVSNLDVVLIIQKQTIGRGKGRGSEVSQGLDEEVHSRRRHILTFRA